MIWVKSTLGAVTLRLVRGIVCTRKTWYSAWCRPRRMGDPVGAFGPRQDFSIADPLAFLCVNFQPHREVPQSQLPCPIPNPARFLDSSECLQHGASNPLHEWKNGRIQTLLLIPSVWVIEHCIISTFNTIPSK